MNLIQLYFPYLLSLILLIALFYREEMFRKERKDLLRMIKAKDLTEVVSAERVEKQEIKAEEIPDIVPLENASDEEFMEAIRK